MLSGGLYVNLHSNQNDVVFSLNLEIHPYRREMNLVNVEF